MNKKILLSVAAAATLAMTFTGCGSSDSTTAANTTTSDGTGSFTLADGTTGYAMKGALNSATVSQSGATVALSGGIDSITGLAPTLNVETDTELLDEDDNVIGNVYTTVAMQYDGNKTRAMGKVASAFGLEVSDLVKQIKDTQGDVELENKGRMIAQLLKSAKAQGSMQALTDAIDDSNGTATFEELLGELNAALPEALMTPAQITASVANIGKQASQFAIESALFDAAVEAGTAADYNVSVVENKLITTGIILDSNTTTTTGAVVSISDMNLTSNLTDANITTEGGELLFEIGNLAENDANANASYALKLSKLTTNVANNMITGFSANTNTTLVITANSNMSKALTFDGSDVNVTALFACTDLNNSLDINATAFTNYITSVVGTDNDDTNETTTTNGNFTSGMTASGNFYHNTLLNVDSYEFITSDKMWKIEKSDMRIDGVSEAGYLVIDSNLTK